MAEGTILCMFDGFFYSFASEENWEEFQSHPDLYALRAEDLLTDEEYLAQAVRDFKALENAAAQSGTPSPLATPNQVEPNQPGESFSPVVDTDQGAVADEQLTLNQQLDKTPTVTGFDLGNLNLIPPPPVAADQDIVREESVFGSLESEDPVVFESPFEDDVASELADAATPEKGLAEASRVLGLTDSNEPPERLEDKRNLTLAPATPRESEIEPADGVGQGLATVHRWSDLGLQESRTDTQAVETQPQPQPTPKSAPRFTDSEPPRRQVRTASPRNPSEVRRAPVESVRTPIEPRRINEASVIAKRIGERLSPKQPAPKGWASFITQSGKPTGRTTQQMSFTRTNRFDRALQSEDQGFRVTQITSGVATTPRRPVRSVTSVRASEIRKQRSSASDLKRPTPRANSKLQPIRNSRTAAVVPARETSNKSTLVRPATTSRSSTLKPVASSKFQTLTGKGSKSQAVRQTGGFSSSLLRRK